jgi:hypothetical protein
LLIATVTLGGLDIIPVVFLLEIIVLSLLLLEILLPVLLLVPLLAGVLLLLFLRSLFGIFGAICHIAFLSLFCLFNLVIPCLLFVLLILPAKRILIYKAIDHILDPASDIYGTVSDGSADEKDCVSRLGL